MSARCGDLHFLLPEVHVSSMQGGGGGGALAAYGIEGMAWFGGLEL